MKTDLFQSCVHWWVFQIYWSIECCTFTASSFRIWNSSAGIPVPPLSLLLAIIPKPTWLHTLGRLAQGKWSHHCNYLGCEDLFLYNSSVYFCHLCLISSILLGPYLFCPLLCLFCLKCSLGKRCILMYVPLNLFTGQQWRSKHREQPYGPWRREERREWGVWRE